MRVAAFVIAIYAGLVATASAVWQVFMWWHQRRLDVVVDLDEVESHFGPDMPGVSETFFEVTVINRSSFPVKVTAVTLVPVGEPVRSHSVDETLGLPRDVRGRDAEEIMLPLGYFVGALPDGPVEAWIRLATGEEVRSRPTSLVTRFGGPPRES